MKELGAPLDPKNIEAKLYIQANFKGICVPYPQIEYTNYL